VAIAVNLPDADTLTEPNMKRKSPRGIPDFSSKRKGPPDAAAIRDKPLAPVTPRERNIKPPATSVKSGRRGQ
jgi:hypothetical protein